MATFEDTTRDIAVSGGNLHYNELGQGPALICIHGGGSGANAWDNNKWVLESLAAQYRVLMVDLPGYGTSSNIEADPGESRDRYYARAILGFMDALKIDRAHFYAPSMSGAPVIRLAHDHPGRVFKIVLKSPAGMGPSLLTPSPMDGIMALNDFRKDPTYENMVDLMRRFIPRKELLTKELIDVRFASAQQAMQLAPAKLAPVEASDIRSLLSKLTMPVLVLWGRQDRMVALDGALSALALIPDVQVHLWGGNTGHFLEYEHPEAFASVVLPFLND